MKNSLHCTTDCATVKSSLSSRNHPEYLTRSSVLYSVLFAYNAIFPPILHSLPRMVHSQPLVKIATSLTASHKEHWPGSMPEFRRGGVELSHTDRTAAWFHKAQAYKHDTTLLACVCVQALVCVDPSRGARQLTRLCIHTHTFYSDDDFC